MKVAGGQHNAFEPRETARNLEFEHEHLALRAAMSGSVENIVAALLDPETRENALLDLSKKRCGSSCAAARCGPCAACAERGGAGGRPRRRARSPFGSLLTPRRALSRDLFADLAPILWHSYGVIPALLQEIVSIYPLLSPPSLTAHASNRVCNALALLQCVASHPDTRALFLNGATSPSLAPRGVAGCSVSPARSHQPSLRLAQPTSRSSSTRSSTPSPRRGPSSTYGSPAWASSELW